MSLTPVIVGIGQVEQRIKDPSQAKEPLELMLNAIQQAEADTDSRVLEEISSIRVIKGVWPYQNPGKSLAESLGLANVETGMTPFGGNYVQMVVNQTALDIQSGEQSLVVITGAECGATQARARKAGEKLRWKEDTHTAPDRFFGEDVPMVHDAEREISLTMPVQYYPLFENALRHAQGTSVADHQKHISELWARFSRVAEGNPHAWIKQPKSAEEIRTPSATNRPISFPYPKLMNSNSNVDLGAALILCSTETATRLGIDESKWVYPLAGTDAHDHNYVSHRENLYSSPAIRIAGKACLDLAGVTPDNLDHIDLYSCFPVAVQVAAAELGLDITRPLTITGGLTWGGGPLNNYVMHSIARMVELLRENPDQKGLITANGGWLTKHAFGVYSGNAPEHPYRHQDLQAQVDASPTREVITNYVGPATIESYVVMYGADGPVIANLACLTPDGKRTWANCDELERLQDMTETEYCGKSVIVNENIVNFS